MEISGKQELPTQEWIGNGRFLNHQEMSSANLGNVQTLHKGLQQQRHSWSPGPAVYRYLRHRLGEETK